MLARVVCQASWTASATELRRSLHWLPVRHRILYKTALITYKTQRTGSPSYLAELIKPYEPVREHYDRQPYFYCANRSQTTTLNNVLSASPRKQSGTRCAFIPEQPTMLAVLETDLRTNYSHLHILGSGPAPSSRLGFACDIGCGYTFIFYCIVLYCINHC